MSASHALGSMPLSLAILIRVSETDGGPECLAQIRLTGAPGRSKLDLERVVVHLVQDSLGEGFVIL